MNSMSYGHLTMKLVRPKRIPIFYGGMTIPQLVGHNPTSDLLES
jgi:hypothetical protein